MRYFLSLLTLLTSLLGQIVTAQSLMILPLEADNQPFAMEQLWQASVVNPTTQPIEAILEIQLQDKNHRKILTATSAPTVGKKGATVLPPSVRATMRMVYEKTQLGTTLRETSRLPFGNYIICYRCLDARDQSLLGLACRERNVAPIVPPELISPTDKEVIQTTQPLLLWRGPLPLQQGVRYALRLVEKTTDQADALQSVSTRPPLVNMNILDNQFLPYPVTAQPLQDGKSYAWQVEAWADKVSLGVTDAWSFQVQMPPPPPPIVPTNENFCWMKETNDATYCVPSATDSLRFMFDNIEKETALSPKIYNVNNQEVGGSMPTLPLREGINALSMRILGKSGIASGAYYRLVFINAKGRQFFLWFRPR